MSYRLARKARTARLNASGCSTLTMCPEFSITTSRAPGILVYSKRAEGPKDDFRGSQTAKACPGRRVQSLPTAGDRAAFDPD